MSQTETVDTGRSDEEQLKALVRKDIDPGITAMAKEALRRIQEGSL